MGRPKALIPKDHERALVAIRMRLAYHTYLDIADQLGFTDTATVRRDIHRVLYERPAAGHIATWYIRECEQLIDDHTRCELREAIHRTDEAFRQHTTLTREWTAYWRESRRYNGTSILPFRPCKLPPYRLAPKKAS